ncbi:MAG: hypothetical protein SFT91_05750, partial [Rickettsiaceae bacterium]|nr:hypothetical protein [Rickettsiaceae bacterium]
MTKQNIPHLFFAVLLSLVFLSSNIPRIKVKISIAENQEFHKTLILPAECKSIKSRDYTAKSDGYLDYVKENSSLVKKGDLIVAIDQKLSESKKGEAESSIKYASLNFERDKNLFEKKVISQEKFEQSRVEYYNTSSNALNTLKSLEDKLIIAPFDGKVSAVNVKIGDYVRSNEFLLNITSG